jgi:hypothetical protein
LTQFGGYATFTQHYPKTTSKRMAPVGVWLSQKGFPNLEKALEIGVWLIGMVPFSTID